MACLAKAARGVVRGKSVHAAIAVRPRRASRALRSAKTRQSPTTCSRRHSGKMVVAMQAAAEAPAPVVVRPARVGHAAVRDKVTLVVVAAMQAGKVSRAAAIVLLGPTIHRVALSQIR